MTSIKLAIKNVLRIPGRSILIGIIMLVISISVLVSLSIQSGTEETLADARKKLGNDVTLQVNMQNIQKKLINNMKNQDSSSKPDFTIEHLTEKLADKYTSSEYVSNYDYTMETSLTTDMEVIGENNNNNVAIQSIGSKSSGEFESPKLKLVSNLKPQYQEEFRNGNKTITEGRFYTEEEVKNKESVVVISKNLANLNDLKVGDTLKVKTLSLKEDDKTEIELEIIGLYEDKVQQDVSMPIPYMFRDNEIYTPLTTARSFSKKNSDESIINSATYFIDDPANIQAFKDEVETSGLNLENFALDANDESYAKMAGPLEKLNSIIKLFLIIVIITGSVIMVLLMTMTTRERKLEVGILRSLGVKRKKIAFQFITETLIIVSLALAIGVVSGKSISQKTADYLLQKEITAQKEAESEIQNNPFSNMIFMDGTSSTESNAEVIDKIETKIESKEILTLILIALFISSCGSIISSYWIMKYEPMKILSNRV